ncbi:hypothetical protein [Neomesorhizobium albiziae]|nr:hypothetical protein [Mesorhizobium albiziae]
MTKALIVNSPRQRALLQLLSALRASAILKLHPHCASSMVNAGFRPETIGKTMGAMDKAFFQSFFPNAFFEHMHPNRPPKATCGFRPCALLLTARLMPFETIKQAR